jgi:hypothetical protein
MACVEEEDCRVTCDADRVKRAAEEDPPGRIRNEDLEPPVWNKKRTAREVGLNKGRTEGWRENLEIRVVSLPEQGAPLDSSSDSVSECRLYLIVTLATALTFCLLSAAIVVFACLRNVRAAQEHNISFFFYHRVLYNPPT